ncbi:MAG: Co2+/Mg2+ efflux protein ApaG [Bdellovibrionales bacterium]|nr:Co2+/Mg2+ efflux protein ApaG [Bdellovibrionales bacterium]
MTDLRPDEGYSLITNHIKITVVPEYLTEHSDPKNNVYAFSYNVTIENLGSDTVQLINRHWIVFSGGIQFADVKGEGVIGLQPVLNPGDSFQYGSGSTIDDVHGSMHGTYTFQNENGEFFDVKIPRFDLICLDIVN